MTQGNAMTHLSNLTKSAAIAALLAFAGALPAQADNPPAKLRQAPRDNPEVKRLTMEAAKAIKAGNISLATIQLKNALRLDPDNGSLRVQLGYVLLQSGDVVSAEREIRQGRLNGAKDEDAVPPLLQAMVARQEFSDILAQFPEPAPGDKSRLAGAILRARAESNQQTQHLPEAVASMDRALTIQRDAPGLLERARIAVLQGEMDQGMNFINQALQLAPNNPAAMMMKASIVRSTDKKAALGIIDNLLKAHPESVGAQVARIEMLLDMRKLPEAKQMTDAVLAKMPSLPIGQFYRAVLLGTEKKHVEAWRIAQSLPSEFVQANQRIAVGVAQMAVASGNSAIGNTILTTYVGQHANDNEARVRLAALRLQLNSGADALEILQPLMNSPSPAVMQLIAAAYGRAGQPAKAIEYLRKAQTAGANDPSLKYQVAMADLAQKNTTQAISALGDLVKQDPKNLQPAVTGVEALLRQANYADAQTLADAADKANPKSPVGAFLKGQIQFSQNKPDAALPFFNQALQRDAKFRPALFARAQISAAKGKYADASKDLNQAKALQPNNPDAYVRLAEIAAVQKQDAQTISLLREGISRAPKTNGTRLVLARYQIVQRRFPDALATLKDALKVSPNDGQTLALMGQVQQAMGQKKEALTTNKTLTQKYQKSGAAQALLANSLLASGDKKGAIKALREAIELSPDMREYHAALIEMQLTTGDKEGAVFTAKSWADTHRGPEGPIMLAQTLVNVGRAPEAATVVSRAQGVRPDPQLTILESQIAIVRNDKAHALSALKNWVAGHATDYEVRQAYGDLMLRYGDNAGALAQYEAILKARPDAPGVLNNAAWLLREKDLTRALTMANRAALLAPGSPDIADTLGYLLLQRKDAKSALPVLQKAYTTAPANGAIGYHLAIAYNELGQKAQAKKTLQDTLAKAKNFDEAAAAKKLLATL
jgi:putative PEP-CTERM system TPR-repeat lipoprotein